MDINDVNAIIAEISNLNNKGVLLSESLDCDRITSEYEDIEYQSSKGRYVLPRMYRLVKGIQKSINACLYGNDINVFITLFSTVEAIRQKLGQEYQKRAEISSKVRDLRKMLNEEKPVS
jgi:tetrahydromethanopterin S-methyltransferase subunit F